MKKLKATYEAHGYTGRRFAKAVGVSPPVLAGFTNDKYNPVPSTLAKMLAELNCRAEDVITPGEFDYGPARGNIPSKAKRPDRRRKTAKTECRTDVEKRGLFAAACAAKGVTMQEEIERHMDKVIRGYLKKRVGRVA